MAGGRQRRDVPAGDFRDGFYGAHVRRHRGDFVRRGVAALLDRDDLRRALHFAGDHDLRAEGRLDLTDRAVRVVEGRAVRGHPGADLHRGSGHDVPADGFRFEEHRRKPVVSHHLRRRVSETVGLAEGQPRRVHDVHRVDAVVGQIRGKRFRRVRPEGVKCGRFAEGFRGGRQFRHAVRRAALLNPNENRGLRHVRHLPAAAPSAGPRPGQPACSPFRPPCQSPSRPVSSAPPASCR